MWLAGQAALDFSCVTLWSAALGLNRVALRYATLGLSHVQLASAHGAHPPGVSGVGPHSANLGAHNRASGEHWSCLSRVHSPGAEGGEAPEATAAGESSLTSG